MARNDAGLSVLVRSAQKRGRPASARDALAVAGATARHGGTVLDALDRVDWARVPLADAGTEVLIRASHGARREAPAPVAIGSEVSDRVESINGAWLTLKSDMSSARTAGTVTEAFQAAFLRDWNAWFRFYNEHHDDWIGSRMLTPVTWAECERWRVRLESWRSAFVAAGGTPTGVPTEPLSTSVLDRLASSPATISDAARAASNISAAIAITAVAAVVALVVIEMK